MKRTFSEVTDENNYHNKVINSPAFPLLNSQSHCSTQLFSNEAQNAVISELAIMVKYKDCAGILSVVNIPKVHTYPLIIESFCRAVFDVCGGETYSGVDELQKFGTWGACEILMQLMNSSAMYSTTGVTEWVCRAIGCLCWNFDNSKKFFKMRVCEGFVTTLNSMVSYQYPNVATAVCVAIRILCFRDNEHFSKIRLGDLGACEALVRLLTFHYRLDKEMAKNGSWTITAMSSSCIENKHRFRNAGGESLLSDVVAYRLIHNDSLVYSRVSQTAHDQLKMTG